MSPIKVMLVDDEDLVRHGISQALSGEPDIEVVADVGSGEAITVGGRLRPELILMEVVLAGRDGLEVAKALVERAGGDWTPRIIMLTSRDRDEYLLRALRIGLSGFILKNVKRDELVLAVRAVAAGGAVISPAMTRRIIERFDILPPPGVESLPKRFGDLSQRELDVLKAIGQGMSNREIAREFHLTSATIKSHVSRMLAKLGLRDRVQAALLAHRLRLNPATRFATPCNGADPGAAPVDLRPRRDQAIVG